MEADVKKQPSSAGVTNGLDLESESIDISSGALLARMRRRNANVTGSQASGGDKSANSEENTLLKDIQQYMLSKVDNTASSNDLTSFFKARLREGQNALFKELLKQICTFQKENGIGKWTLKGEFKT